jgi:hypothetical protein
LSRWQRAQAPQANSQAQAWLCRVV